MNRYSNISDDALRVRALWRAVIVQLIVDAKKPGRHKDAHAY